MCPEDVIKDFVFTVGVNCALRYHANIATVAAAMTPAAENSRTGVPTHNYFFLFNFFLRQEQQRAAGERLHNTPGRFQVPELWIPFSFLPLPAPPPSTSYLPRFFPWP